MPTPAHLNPADLARYSRQVRFDCIGESGQARLLGARVAIVGCGALGSVAADQLVRAGVGMLRLIDRDFIELSNLQRQTLYDETDLADGLPKALAAARKLARINSSIQLDPQVGDVSAGTIERLCGGCDLLLDATDNLETRYLLNDFAVARGVPWVYGGCVAAEGVVLGVLPGKGPCLRCTWPEPPVSASLPTCETSGVLGPAAAIVASLQVIEALKILVGREDELAGLLAVDAWTGRLRQLMVRSGGRSAECPCCVGREFPFLRGQRGSATTVLCGRNAVQVRPATDQPIDLPTLARRLPGDASPRLSTHLLRFAVGGLTVTVFPDGRAIVQGTSDPAVARSTVARYVGA